MEADGLLVGESEVCESIEEVVVLVAQERLYLLYWSWIGDSSLPVLNRGMERLRDVDDHIWSTQRPVQALRASVCGNYSGGKRLR